MSKKTIMYCHGRGSSGRGSKATKIMEYFSEHHFVGNDYPTNDKVEIDKNKPMDWPLYEMKDFWQYVQMLKGDIQIHKPDVIVASSFGGAVFMRVLLEGAWTGPTVFLSMAGAKFGVGDRISTTVPAIFIHGLDDTVVEIKDVQALAEASASSFIAVKDGHRLKEPVSYNAYIKAIQTFLD